jgi:uroporphyrinogen decarboxylase
MNGRERFLAALNRQKPDRLPCQVHCWMQYYLKTYLGGIDQYAAYSKFGMDSVIRQNPIYIYNDNDLANWQIEHVDLGIIEENECWHETIKTPAGNLTSRGASNQFTGWLTEHPIKRERDFEIWSRYVPLPVKVDWTPVRTARERIGSAGIVRGEFFDFGQGSPWQSFCTMFDTEPAIMAAMDKPDWVEHVLNDLLKKKLQVIERAGRFEYDVVETGGGAGSSTVISPDLHRRFCLPYDRIQHEAIHNAGSKTSYHLCGGLMPLLEIVAQNGTDGLETMTPPEMGGDCDLAEAARRVGDKMFFIGGFDQNKGFENGNPALVKEMVFKLFNSCSNGGYICSPSDHFFFGNVENVRAFADAAKECIYD